MYVWYVCVYMSVWFDAVVFCNLLDLYLCVFVRYSFFLCDDSPRVYRVKQYVYFLLLLLKKSVCHWNLLKTNTTAPHLIKKRQFHPNLVKLDWQVYAKSHKYCLKNLDACCVFILPCCVWLTRSVALPFDFDPTIFFR